MNKNFYRWLAGAMCAAALCLGAQSAQAQVENVDDYVYIEDFSIAAGVDYEIEHKGTVTLAPGFKVEKGATFSVTPSEY